MRFLNSNINFKRKYVKKNYKINKTKCFPSMRNLQTLQHFRPPCVTCKSFSLSALHVQPANASAKPRN